MESRITHHAELPNGSHVFRVRFLQGQGKIVQVSIGSRGLSCSVIVTATEKSFPVVSAAPPGWPVVEYFGEKALTPAAVL